MSALLVMCKMKKSKTQAEALHHLVKQKTEPKIEPMYAQMVLTPRTITKKQYERLLAGDLLLWEESMPKLYLLQDNTMRKLHMNIGEKMALVQEDAIEVPQNSHKSEVRLIASVGQVGKSQLSGANQIPLAYMAFDKVVLYVEDVPKAQGRMVWVNEQIAVEITKVEQ